MQIQPQFIKQRHTASCGPAAIVNTMKWAGIDASLRGAYAKLVKTGNVLNGTGIHAPEFFKLLRKSLPKNVMVKQITKKPFAALDAHMTNNDGTKSAIVLYVDGTTKDLGHYTFVPSRGKTGKTFRVTNIGGKAITSRSRKFFVDNMKIRKIKGRQYPQVFLITKKAA